MGEREQCPYTGNECNVQECDSCYTAQKVLEEAIGYAMQQVDENGDPYRYFEGNLW